MLNLIFWTIFGFLAGWVGAILYTQTNRQSLSIAILGVIGGILGGALAQLASGQPIFASYNPHSVLSAVITATAVVALASLLSNRQTSR